MNIKKWISISLIIMALVVLGPANALATGGGGAPGVPGAASAWTYAGKTGIGTAYEQYLNNQYSDSGPTGPISKVWFSLAQGIVTETAFGLIHEAQIKDLQFLVTGNGFFDEEKVATNTQIEYLHTDAAGRPLSLAYRVINTDVEGKYQIEKHIFTDPDRQTLFMRVIFSANEANITPYILINPHIDNTGNADVAWVEDQALYARNVADDVYLSLKSSANFVETSAGFVGASDGWTDLNDNGVMDWNYDWADDGGGNVAMMAQLPTLNNEATTFDVVVGFGHSYNDATAQANGTLNDGYATVLDKYKGVGSNIGWEDYVTGLSNLPGMIAQTGDDGKQLYASALVLKAMEDKTNAGALIASLSIPWGDTVSAESSATGYRAVWPRDFYQVAMAFLALGDTETPRVAFEYLDQVQVTTGTPGYQAGGATGWFLQKTQVDGSLEWCAVQLDQTAMPIMLGWKLWQAGVLSDAEINTWYTSMLKPAAEFLANGGTANLNGGGCDNTTTITPFQTQQERWEEQFGYSPSTTAALIAGLIAAADIGENAAGDPGAADWYRTKADEFADNIENYMFTTTGTHGNSEYFLRITQDSDPNDGDNINGSNGLPAINEKEVLDAGFLELVRYGVRSADDAFIQDTLAELDDTNLSDNLRVKYNFTFESNSYPGWRRYGNDGYGERTGDGSNYVGSASDQRGRVWPFFTGERGHYELEATKAANGGSIDDAEVAALRDTYVRAMEHFANDGLMLPEQVWDGVGSNNTHNYPPGEGTNSATPLAWTHAEYVKLVKSLTDKDTWDSYSIVRDRYQGGGSTISTTFNVSEAYTQWGQNVYVVGNITELGSWSPCNAKPLSPDSYPTWSGTVDLPPSTAVEYKYIKYYDGNCNDVVWEYSINNRTFSTPASGTVTRNDTWDQ